MNKKDTRHFSTKAIRTQHGRSEVKEHSVPIYMTSSYAFDSADEAEAKFAETLDGPIYSRYNNPNIDELALKMAKLEDTETALTTASGMAAIFGAICAHLQAGDHLVSAKAIFGSTFTLLTKVLPRFGIETTFVSLTDPTEWEKAIKPNTKAFFAETPSNPGLALCDLGALADIAKKHKLITIVDNCFATPYVQKPMDFGIDIICHSTTKFIDGQGRTLGGIIAGSETLLEPVEFFLRATGPTLSAFNAWVISKSLETLHVRMDRHCQNALELAEFLQGQKSVIDVRYPYLKSHPQYALAQKQMKQGGGMVSFDLGTKAKAMKFITGLEMISRSANLGDTRSIVTHPVTTTHAKTPDEVRKEVGVTEGLVRMSVGLEDISDIKADIIQALKKI